MDDHELYPRESGYQAWLDYRPVETGERQEQYVRFTRIRVPGRIEPNGILATAIEELRRGLTAFLQRPITVVHADAEPGDRDNAITLGIFGNDPETDRVFPEGDPEADAEAFRLKYDEAQRCLAIGAAGEQGLLYGAFHLLRLMSTRQNLAGLDAAETPVNRLRMINQWDNMDGSVERGYAGTSIFYENDKITGNLQRIRDYARLLASVGINAISINNVNVHYQETKLILPENLPQVAELAGIFRAYGIKLFLSINYAAPLVLGECATADPLDPGVRDWWQAAAAEIYSAIPDFGGFLVKADSENRPGPFTYGRNHADGANMLAAALAPFGGLVIWRCFVYNCKQDWRDRLTDRAKAAYDHFMPLDGHFMDNVILQVKNGPIDFQVREPVSPLLGAMAKTNQVLEFQITQEYTGQQRHVCFLVPQWKEVLDFDTHVKGPDSTVHAIASGALHGNRHGGWAAVSNIGSDANWTGHPLAQANLFGYGRLAWNPGLSAEEIALEWTLLTYGASSTAAASVSDILLNSWSVYESYTAPLGVGFMVNPDHHYGPNVDGYEYSMWGTYHFADCHGIGVDRTTASGTGYTSQYAKPNMEMYESLETCPDELLLFFHHVPYTHVLHSGKTVIQHIYDTHFAGAERAAGMVKQWEALHGEVEPGLYVQVAERLAEQAEHAVEWRDRINTYFYRKSGIPDVQARKIY